MSLWKNCIWHGDDNMLKVEIVHDKQAGYGVDVVSDKDVRWNQSLTWTKNHLQVLDIVEEVLLDYRKD